MPITLKQQMVTDSTSVLLSTSGIAEDVVYTAKNEMPKTISVYADRESMTPVATDDRINSRRSVNRNYLVDRLVVYIPKDATLGVPLVTEQFDFIEMPIKIGGIAETLKVSRIIQDLPGLWSVEVEK